MNQQPTSVNIIKSHMPCRGDHVDPELYYRNGVWEQTDSQATGAIVETIQRLEDETDQDFHVRLQARSSEIDRQNDCFECYHS